MTNLRIARSVIAVALVAGATPLRAAAQQAAVPLPPDSVVAVYCAAWSSADRVTRNSLLARVWANDGVYSDPAPTLASGRDALSDSIASFHRRRPGARFQCSVPQVHHGMMRFTWLLLASDTAVHFPGMDFGELAADGRIRRIVGFFGAPPVAGR